MNTINIILFSFLLVFSTSTSVQANDFSLSLKYELYPLQEKVHTESTPKSLWKKIKEKRLILKIAWVISLAIFLVSFGVLYFISSDAVFKVVRNSFYALLGAWYYHWFGTRKKSKGLISAKNNRLLKRLRGLWILGLIVAGIGLVLYYFLESSIFLAIGQIGFFTALVTFLLEFTIKSFKNREYFKIRIFPEIPE